MTLRAVRRTVAAVRLEAVVFRFGDFDDFAVFLDLRAVGMTPPLFVRLRSKRIAMTGPVAPVSLKRSTGAQPC
jgi:hypothetical protein